MTSIWTEERIERLTELWIAGFSCSEISRALDGVTTRSGVMGKVHRLGLPPRATAFRVPRPPQTNKPLPSPRLGIVQALSEPEFIGPIGLIPDDKMKTCRYPKGDTGTADGWQMCANDGFPYCPYHARVCYEPKAISRQKSADAESRSARSDREMRRMGLA
jgi:GcrA cell cycle regulator